MKLGQKTITRRCFEQASRLFGESVCCLTGARLWPLCCAALLPGCIATSPPLAKEETIVGFAAREWSNYDDGRLYGGVVRPTETLSGILGSYHGCLVEVRSRTLVVLTGAMEFRGPDGNSSKPYVYSKSLLDDQPPSIIALGDRFEVQGTGVGALPADVRLQAPIPESCAGLRVFLTTTETFKPKP